MVAVLDNEGRLQAALRAAKAELAARLAELCKTQAGRSAFEIGAQRASYELQAADSEQKRRDLDRYGELYQAGLISKEAFESRSLAYTSAAMALANADQLSQQSKEVRSVDVRVSEAQVASARASVEQARAALAQAFIRSSVAGQVLRINTRPGERVGDAGLVDIAPTNVTNVVAEVYETEVGRLRVGQSASVEAPALTYSLHGKISRIAQDVERQQAVNVDPAANTNARVIRVYIQLAPGEAPVARKLLNLQVTVHFE